MTSAQGHVLKLFAMRKNQAFLTVKTRFGAAICALGLTILSTAVPAEARRAYSEVMAISTKDSGKHFERQVASKKAARPKPKRRKPAYHLLHPALHLVIKL
ncbi:MAG: hypothetical protein IPI39_19165 [Candidatus Obscuribacter sp.]|nr:hypothetical protein [Candidatus Obscuribacter sp.]